MEFNLKQIESELISTQSRHKTFAEQVESRKEILIANKRKAKNLEEAQNILQVIAQKTQQELEFKIAEIVSMALAAIFDDPYEFKIDFVIRRGKTEADLYFVKNGERFNPIEDNGGGAVDVASFALRVALWNLSQPKTRNTLILDEPFKWLSKKYLSAAGEMLKLISEKLNIQIIMITHIPELIESSDKIIEVTNIKGISQTKEKVA